MESISTINNPVSYRHYWLEVNNDKLKFHPFGEQDVNVKSIIENVEAISIEVKVDPNSVRINSIQILLESIIDQLDRSDLIAINELFFFTSDGPWQDDTRVARYQKLWNRTGYRQSKINEAVEKYECQIESYNGLRYAGCLSLSKIPVGSVVDQLCNIDASFLVAFDCAEFNGEKTVCDLFYAAYPNLETRIVWSNLVRKIHELNCMIIRVDRESRDIDVIFDIFFLVK